MMKIVFLVTGSGGNFYCTNCYRNMLFFRAVKKFGNADDKAWLLYLPPEKIYVKKGFETDVYSGAVSLFFREKIHVMKNMPPFLEKILDSPSQKLMKVYNSL
ncbi:MAG: hypothetical protein ACUVTX_11355 [Bacteroidales bacterium]